MADARALLRAHRSENRIKHPHAAYSDAGKLLCKLCHEHIRSEPLWDTHTRSTSHMARLKAIQRQASPTDSNISSKRKLDDVDDEDMDDAADNEETAAAVRAKRNKTGEESANGTTKTLTPINTAGAGTPTTGAARDKTTSPPLLGRRASNTPIQGVEIAIPSRPATPLARSDSATSTPNIIIANSRSPLASTEGPAGGASDTSRGPVSTDGLQIPSHTSRAASVSSMTVQPPTPAPQRTAPPSATTSAVDESEWAAFEADLATASDENDNVAPAAAESGPEMTTYTDATISAPAMTKAELEARSQEEVNERRKQLLDAQIAGEKEDAARALEEEFDEMEELEGRVKRLKERREQLRRGSLANIKSSSEVPADGGEGAMEVNDNGSTMSAVAQSMEKGAVVVNGPEEEEDEDDDEEGEDEWDGFRFRA